LSQNFLAFDLALNLLLTRLEETGYQAALRTWFEAEEGCGWAATPVVWTRSGGRGRAAGRFPYEFRGRGRFGDRSSPRRKAVAPGLVCRGCDPSCRSGRTGRISLPRTRVSRSVSRFGVSHGRSEIRRSPFRPPFYRDCRPCGVEAGDSL